MGLRMDDLAEVQAGISYDAVDVVNPEAATGFKIRGRLMGRCQAG